MGFKIGGNMKTTLSVSPIEFPTPCNAKPKNRAYKMFGGAGPFNLVSPSDLGRCPIRKIEAPDALRVLGKVEADGTYEESRRLRGTIDSICRYAKAKGRASHDPTEALKGALNDVRRAYLRVEHWDERVQMAEWWAEELDQMRVAAQ
jgi:hypothetical protein